MYKLTWILFAFFSLVLPVLSAPTPVPAPEELHELEKRVTHTGRGTWYYPGLGNCGGTNGSNDLVVAMAKTFYDQNNGKNCGQQVQITSNGKTVEATMVDSCPGCGSNDLDMSPAVFKELAPLSLGVIDITWHFLKR
ncbi:riboflavin aldehyde-forming enzyme [Lactifluus volemus]|nr:riboflavin aldehyde-forming enzyme [Lactifluus volemus]